MGLVCCIIVLKELMAVKIGSLLNKRHEDLLENCFGCHSEPSFLMFQLICELSIFTLVSVSEADTLSFTLPQRKTGTEAPSLTSDSPELRPWNTSVSLVGRKIHSH